MSGDEQLIHQASQGDAIAIEQLLVRHLPGLRAFIRLRAGKLLRAKESSSDLAQSVCREVLEDMDGFQYQGEKAFRQWLYQRGLHKIINRAKYYQAQKRAPDREASPQAPHDSSVDDSLIATYKNLGTPSQELMTQEGIQKIENAFDELPEDYREAIVLHRLVGLSQAEIADAMGRSEGAVRNLVYRGLAKLAVLLGE